MSIRSLSDLLDDTSTNIMKEEEQITLKQLLIAFHERGFGFFLFLFSLPAALPLPGLGINAIIALPLLLLTAQQVMGRHTIWLPSRLQKRTLQREKIINFLQRARPWIQRVEFLIRPRLGAITHGVFSRLIGVFGFIMALCITIPLPLTNTVPAFGIAVMAVGVLMRDGLAVIAGAAIGLTWIILLVNVIILYGPDGIDMIKETIKALL